MAPRGVRCVEGDRIASRSGEAIGVLLAATGPGGDGVAGEWLREDRATLQEADGPLSAKLGEWPGGTAVGPLLTVHRAWRRADDQRMRRLELDERLGTAIHRAQPRQAGATGHRIEQCDGRGRSSEIDP